MPERRHKVPVFSKSLACDDIVGCSLPVLLALIECIVVDVPLENRSAVTVNVVDGEGCSGGYIEFEYSRAETDDEMALRLAEKAKAADWRREHEEHQERQLLARLRQKYGQS